MKFHFNRTLAASILLAAGMSYYYFALLIPHARAGHALHSLDGGYYYGNDLYPIWLTTGELLGHKTDPYTPAMEHRIESGLYGRPLDRSNAYDETVNYRGFSYPLYTDILAAPLALLSFHDVQVVLSILLPIVVAIGVACWCAALGLNLSAGAFASLILLTLFSCPALEGIYALQPTVIVATLIAAALAALRRDHLVMAGILLVVASIKPQLVALPMLWLLLWTLSDWSDRKRLLITFALGMGVLLLASELWLPRWWLSWAHALPEYRRYTTAPLAGLVLGRVLGRVFGLAIIALAGVTAARWRRLPADSPRFFMLFAFLLAISVIAISSSIAVYDQILLLPALLWLWSDRQTILRASRPVRIVTLLLGASVLWPWMVALVLAVDSSFAPWVHSPRVIVLPLITAASFPVVLLGLLGFFVVQAVRNATSDDDTLLYDPTPPLTQGS